MRLTIVIEDSENSRAAYEVLSSRLRMSRLMLKRIRLYGQLLVNDSPARMKDPVFTGDRVEAIYDEDRDKLVINPECNIPIRYEDDWLIVCEKPAGLVTHPSWQHMDDSLIQRLSEQRLHPVMRLDRETSGLIVIAKNGFAHHVISSSTMDKQYLAIIHGVLSPLEGTINQPIGRASDSIMIREVRSDGHPSVTHYATEKVCSDKNISLVRFVLETGRCHQIRVHSRYLGHPLVGDGLYGPRSNDYYDPDFPGQEMDMAISRQALHACALSFEHPVTHEKLSFTSPLPEDMSALLI